MNIEALAAILASENLCATPLPDLAALTPGAYARVAVGLSRDGTRGKYDAVLAMYHDQGHIPVKLLGFHVDPATGKWDALSGVNITLGLPIIRTSVDHGTAFDIAGRGIASERSLIEAIEYAELLATHRAKAA